MTVFRYDADAGALTRLLTQSTLPMNFSGFNTCAAIHAHPNGRFVYASNRGHDSIAVFEFDAAAESLQLRSVHKSGGRTPRDFALTPDGMWLLAAHMDSATSPASASTGRRATWSRPATNLRCRRLFA